MSIVSYNSAFDSKASKYDEEFTTSYVGQFQRKAIHHFVKQYCLGKQGLEILELNSGTGADISFLEEFGNVTATDVSIEMLKIASQKNPDIRFKILDLKHPLPKDKKYDLVFSNFGGFNCISPLRLKELQYELSEILRPGGQIVIVFIHNWSLVEFFYFSLKFQFGKAFRRLKGKSQFNNIPIYYYSKARIKSIFSSLELIASNPIGIFLAGEYMNRFGAKFKLKKNAKWIFPLFGSDHMVYLWKVPD